MKRIVIVQRALAPYRIPLYEALHALPGWELVVVHGPVMGHEPGEPFELSYPLANSSFGPLTWQRNVVDALEDLGPSTVVVGANPWVLSNQRVVRWGAENGVPVYLWGLGFAPGHRNGIRRFAHSAGRRILRKLLARTSGVLAYSNHAAAVYRQCAPRPLPIYVIGNASIANDPTATESLAPRSGSRLLYVGRLSPQKRVDVLIEALSLPSADPSWELDIVGTGSQESALRRMAQDRHAHGVRFHGHQSQSEVQRLMQSAHFLVLPGRGGLAVQEALARGLPVIALPGRYGGGDGTIDDFLDSTVAGELVNGRSAEALCDALVAGFANEDWRDRQHAAFEVSSRYGGLDGVVERFRRAVESALT